MAVRRRIYVWFLVGETVYLYSPKLFGKHEIKEEKVMTVSTEDVIGNDIALFGSCPSCSYEVSGDMYFCPCCGQALDWSEKE